MTTKDGNTDNAPHLEISEAALIHCNIVNSDYSDVQESCINSFTMNKLVNY